MSRHEASYVISYHGILCHGMSYVTTIAASLVHIYVLLQYQLLLYHAYISFITLYSAPLTYLRKSSYVHMNDTVAGLYEAMK